MISALAVSWALSTTSDNMSYGGNAPFFSMILETILALTPLDYDHLARAVQVEAARGTMDEFCVAVSILNRVRSPKYPNTVANVVYSPGQYEGFRYWRPVAKQSVVNRLKNTEKLLEGVFDYWRSHRLQRSENAQIQGCI